MFEKCALSKGSAFCLSFLVCIGFLKFWGSKWCFCLILAGDSDMMVWGGGGGGLGLGGFVGLSGFLAVRSLGSVGSPRRNLKFRVKTRGNLQSHC